MITITTPTATVEVATIPEAIAALRRLTRKPSPPPNPSRAMKRTTGKTKTCRQCGASFPIIDRATCRAVRCEACRPAYRPVRTRPCSVPGCTGKVTGRSEQPFPCQRHRRPAEARVPLGLYATPTPRQRPVPAPARKVTGPQPCRDCGDPTAPFELHDGRCFECTPIGARRTA